MSKKLKRKIFLKLKSDFFYQSYWFSKFTNKLMLRGRKKAVQKMISSAFQKIRLKHHKNGLKILFLALIKNRPLLWFSPIRLGREIKRVPIPISARRQLIISLSWFVLALKILRVEAKTVPFQEVFYQQLKDALYKKETILTQRRIAHMQDLVENRVNLHHRWKIKR